jgi:hypothetical protein
MEVKKKTLHVIFAFNSNSSQIEHIYKKYKHKEKKNKTKCEGATNKSMKAPNIFGIFCYRKGVRLVKYQIRMGIKIMAKA